jgi:Asp-tRNA(Asn)/Glu-tRNA(Gln) amidotransferase A subunit family amidase
MLEKIKQAGVRIYSRADLPLVERVEVALHQALPLTRLINAWESLWPLNTYCHYHPELISDYLRDRLREAQNITADDYQKAVAERKAIRQLYHQLSEQAGACITLSAPDVAPLGLSSTGDPIFVVQGSFLGTPALNLPALTLNDLPLGVQMLGFTQHDAALFGYAAFVEDIIMSSKNV